MTKIGVGILVQQIDEILLLQRGKSIDKAGTWGLCGGRLEEGEDWQTGAARELFEETGLVCDPADIKQLSFVNYVDDNDVRWIVLFCEATKWTGEVINREPEKCSGLQWFNVNNLPSPLFSPLESYLIQSRSIIHKFANVMHYIGPSTITIDQFSEHDINVIRKVLKRNEDCCVHSMDLRGMLNHYIENPKEEIAKEWLYEILREVTDCYLL